MAMVFALVTHLREALVTVIQKRTAKEKEREQERERELMEVINLSPHQWVYCTDMYKCRLKLPEQEVPQ